MRTISKGEKVFKFYDSIHELSALRFNHYEQYVIQDDGIGNGVTKLVDHLNASLLLLSQKDIEKATTEISNMYRSLFLTIHNKDTSLFALASLCFEVDGIKKDSMIVNDLEDLGNEIGTLPKEELDLLFSDVKKKYIKNLNLN